MFNECFVGNDMFCHFYSVCGLFSLLFFSFSPNPFFLKSIGGQKVCNLTFETRIAWSKKGKRKKDPFYHHSVFLYVMHGKMVPSLHSTKSTNMYIIHVHRENFPQKSFNSFFVFLSDFFHCIFFFLEKRFHGRIFKSMPKLSSRLISPSNLGSNVDQAFFSTL